MKNWSRIIALALVLVVLIASYVLLKGGKAPGSTDAQASATPTGAQASSTPKPDVTKLFDFARTDIVKILLKRDTGDITLTLKETEVETQTQDNTGKIITDKQTVNLWTNDGFKVDSTVADSITYAVENLSTSRLIEADPQDLSIYGLDKPNIVTLYNADGKSESLEIGNSTPTNEGRYVKRDGDKAVYTLGSYYVDNFTVSKYDLMSKQLYDKEGMIADNISKLAFYKGDEEIFDSYMIDPAQPGVWNITYPIMAGADYVDLEKFLTGLATRKITAIIEDKPSDLALYGLDKPQYTFNYTLDGKEYVLKLGSLKGTAYYAMMGDQNYVFTIDSTGLTSLDMPAIDVIDLLVYVPAIFNTSKLEIEIDGRTDVLEMDVQQKPLDSDVYIFNGKKIDTEDNKVLFRRYYQGAIALMGDKLEPDANPQGEPFIRLTYTAKTGFVNERKTTVELIPTPDGYGYYLMKNKKYTGLVMGKRQLDREDMGIRTSYQNLINGLNGK